MHTICTMVTWVLGWIKMNTMGTTIIRLFTVLMVSFIGLPALLGAQQNQQPPDGNQTSSINSHQEVSNPKDSSLIKELETPNLSTEDLGLMKELLKPKDPFLAGLLSALFMGGGQFYNKQYLKGSVLLITDLVMKTSIILSMVFIADQYPSYHDSLLTFADLDGKDKTILFGLGTGYLGVYIFNIVDAVRQTHLFNQKYFMFPSLKLTAFSDPSLQIGYSMGVRF